MANISAAFGLRPVRHLNGNPWNGYTRKYLKEDGLDEAHFICDPIVMTGTAPSDDPTGIYPAIKLATQYSTFVCHGIIMSFDLIGPTGLKSDTVYSPKKESRYVNVCVDPDVIFIIQGDGASATLTVDAIGANVDYVSGSGSTSTGLSGWMMDDSSISQTAVDNLLILGVWPEEGKEMGDYCVWEVLISHHGFRCQTGITGV